jgi:F-type H+-transporting ATPase subunit epsilon
MANSADLLSLEVATPVGLALSTECELIAAPSVQGEFGVLPNHLPLLAALRSGVIKYRVEGKDMLAAVGPGFVEAGPHRVLLLTDSFARPEDVRAEDVREELADAEKQLTELDASASEVEREEIMRAIEWAHARLAIIEH